VFARGLRLDRAVLERWADFDAEIGIVEQRPDVDRAFDLTLAG
jgi:putative hydroxymethylpyrimidine transport system substrate-binding protein